MISKFSKLGNHVIIKLLSVCTYLPTADNAMRKNGNTNDQTSRQCTTLLDIQAIPWACTGVIIQDSSALVLSASEDGVNRIFGTANISFNIR